MRNQISSACVYFCCSAMSHKKIFQNFCLFYSHASFLRFCGQTLGNKKKHMRGEWTMWQKLALMHLLSEGECKERWRRRGKAVTQPFPGQTNKQLNTSRVLTCFICSQVPDKAPENDRKCVISVNSSGCVVVEGALADGFWVISLLSAVGYANKSRAPMATSWPCSQGILMSPRAERDLSTCCVKHRLKPAASADSPHPQ